MELTGKTVLITGGSRGIGAALARAFSESGAKVSIMSRTEEEVHTLADELGGLAVVGDVRFAEDCDRAVQETVEHFGKVDIIINNAGVAINKPFTEHSEQDYDTIMETNVKGVFLMTQAAFKHSHPHIVVSISSGAGRMGMPGLSVYCASKFAVRGFMESLSQETHAKVYTVLPGAVDTQMFRELYDTRARTKPEQVADAIVTLCQEEPETGFELVLSH